VEHDLDRVAGDKMDHQEDEDGDPKEDQHRSKNAADDIL
jgi:hypothetical protein